MEVLQDILKQNSAEISAAVGCIGLLISIFGVRYSYKSYKTALDIFNKGIQLDKQKILEQVSLELVINFCIPFSKFCSATEEIWDGMNVSTGKIDKMDISYIRTCLSNKAFSVNFPYINLHKGEIWDALKECDEMPQAKDFNLLMEFLEKAKKFDRFILDIHGQIDEYMNPKDPKLARDSELVKARASAKVKDFFDEFKEYDKTIFNEINRRINEIKQIEDELSKVLKIKEMKTKLYKI